MIKHSTRDPLSVSLWPSTTAKGFVEQPERPTRARSSDSTPALSQRTKYHSRKLPQLSLNANTMGTVKRTAVVLGFDYHVGVFCRKMNAHATAWRFLPYTSTKLGLMRAALKLRTADALIRFAGPAPHPTLLAVARACKVPIFVIWAGTDVTSALQGRYKMAHAQRAEITHLAVAPWLVDELREVGIEATYIPIIGMRPSLGPEVPRGRFDVLTYLPEPRRDFYGKGHVYELARRLPHVGFSIIGPGSPDRSAPPNIIFYGWVSDSTPLIDSSAVLLRVPEHDGMSLVVLEALSRGRHVAWNYALPGVHQVTTTDDSFRYLSELHELHAAGKLAFNLDGFNFIKAAYEERQVSLDVERFLQTAVDAAAKKRSNSRQIAILGLELFATDVAELNKGLQNGWSAQVLQFGTKYEIISSLYSFTRCDLWYTVGMPSVGRSLQVLSKLFKKPRVMHWVGTDIELARKHPKILAGMLGSRVSHLTEVEWEAEELRTLGINAKITPLPPRFSCTGPVPPLPSEFTLLIYLPSSRPFFYGSREVETVIHAFRDRPVKFLIVGGWSVDAAPNLAVENLGWRYSLADVYSRSSALLRFTERDGLSLMVLEALAFGRHVLWTKSLPFVTQVRTVEAIIAELNKLVDLNEKGDLKPQVDAAEFIRTNYDRKRCITQITSAWDAALLASRKGIRRE